jgi:1-deoxy-D-xylulose 5-phosphate reductoisomerase
MKKRILILGSDTQKGQVAFNFFKEYPKKFLITGLFCYKSENLKIFINQIKISNADHILVNNKEDSLLLEKELNIDSFYNISNISKFIKTSKSDIVVFSIPGVESVIAALSAISEFKDICIMEWDPILYSGKIVIDEIENKAVKLYPISLKLYSIDLFLNQSNFKSLKTVNLVTTSNSKLDLSYLDNPKMYDYEEFKNKFIEDFKIDFVIEMFILNYIYNISIDKFKFFEQNNFLFNMFLTFEQGHSLTNFTTNNIYNVFNYYFLNDNDLKNKNLVSTKTLNNIKYNIKEIDIEKIPAVKYGVKSLKKSYFAAILYYITGQICVELLYEQKIKYIKITSIIKSIINDPKFDLNNYDFKTILAIYEKVKTEIYSYI